MSDKRSVATDALETLGTIIGEGAGRDAIHLAVEPVVAAGWLHPGQSVGLLGNGMAGLADASDLVGIVDPFLKTSVKPGEKFWLILYPRQITSLRHVWSHPAFPDEPTSSPPNTKSASEVWLRDFVNTIDTSISYEEIIGRAAEGSGNMCFSDDIYGEIPDEFWDHAEIVVGKKITDRDEYFHCAC